MSKSVKRTITFILLVFGLPLVALILGQSLVSDGREQISSWPSAQTAADTGDALLWRVCANPKLASHERATCVTYEGASLLRDASLYAIGAGLLLILIVRLTARAGRTRPALLASLFGVEVRVVSLYLCGLTLLQGITATAVVVLIMIVVKYNGVLLPVGAMMFATGAGAIQMMWVALHVIRPLRSQVLAIAVSRQAQPLLWATVERLAESLGAAAPKNIILGLDTVFFASAGGVILPSSPTPLQGETLYLSVPFMRLLSQAELSCVIGHELGHFKGRDTVYTQRFLPIYLGMGAGIASIYARRNPLRRAALYPALAFLSFCYAQFQIAERSNARTRELAADACGARVGNAMALVTGLLKTSEFAPAWSSAVRDMIAAIEAGTPVANAGAAFERHARQMHANAVPGGLVAGILESHQPHPIDTHPTLRARAAALAIAPADAAGALTLEGDMSIALIDHAPAVEGVLTAQLGRFLLGSGLAKRPSEDRPDKPAVPAQGTAATTP